MPICVSLPSSCLVSCFPQGAETEELNSTVLRLLLCRKYSGHVEMWSLKRLRCSVDMKGSKDSAGNASLSPLDGAKQQESWDDIPFPSDCQGYLCCSTAQQAPTATVMVLDKKTATNVCPFPLQGTLIREDPAQMELEGADPQGDSKPRNPSSEFGSGRVGSARHLLDLGGQESLHSLVALLAGDFPRTWGAKSKQKGQSVTSQAEPCGWCARGRSCAWGALPSCPASCASPCGAGAP